MFFYVNYERQHKQDNNESFRGKRDQTNPKIENRHEEQLGGQTAMTEPRRHIGISNKQDNNKQDNNKSFRGKRDRTVPKIARRDEE